MKATINGITIEGTPQEIMEYQRAMEVKVSGKLVPPAIDTYWFKSLPKINSGATKCPNSGSDCFCTGECKG